MTQASFPVALAATLRHEGGWSDHPRDPGGATMRGITLRVYSNYLGRDATKEELRSISDDELTAIYRASYWDACRCDDLPAGIDYAVFDAAVNSGPGRAAKLLQASVNVTVDGAIGAKTIKAVCDADAIKIIETLCEERLEFLRSLPTFDAFGKGWTSRVNHVRDQAIALVKQPVLPSQS